MKMRGKLFQLVEAAIIEKYKILNTLVHIYIYAVAGTCRQLDLKKSTSKPGDERID